MGKIKIQKKDVWIDMTPMSDVMTLLLCFFMLTSTFLQPEPIKVNTPSSVSEVKVPENNVLNILVSPEGKIYVGTDNKNDMVAMLQTVTDKFGVSLNGKQLKNFKTQCRPSQQDLIPMIDIEVKQGMSTEAFRDSVAKFLDMIEETYHQKPLIYTGTNFYNKNLVGLLDGYKLMIAQYSANEPILADDKDYMLWQYTGKGYIDGVRGYVDKSRFMGRHGLRELKYQRRR